MFMSNTMNEKLYPVKYSLSVKKDKGQEESLIKAFENATWNNSRIHLKLPHKPEEQDMQDDPSLSWVHVLESFSCYTAYIYIHTI